MSAVSSQLPLPRPRVLLVDDDPATCELFAAALLHHGFDVIVAGTSYDALMLAEDQSPQAVVVDIGLPDLNGLELLRELQTVCDELVVAVCSGYVDMHRRALRAGAAAFFPKPCDTEQLARTLRMLISARMQGGAA
jgi:two-component system KDP operon response regulator KdpE